jgi:hypothetical protein
LLHLPNNIRLIQFFTFFNNALLFVEISGIRIQAIIERISAPDVIAEEIQEAGEDLGTLLGRVLEAKMGGRRIIRILEELRRENYRMKRHWMNFLNLPRILNKKLKICTFYQQK